MRLLLTAIVAALALAPAAHAAPLTFILAGQSNMVGLAQPIPPERASAKVKVWTGSAWVPALDPLYQGGGVGPSITFGRRVATASGRTVQLIPCAYSGTRIAEWLPGYVPQGSSDPAEYDLCLARARASGAHVDGLIFYQGETDAILPEWANVWAAQFATMVADWRRDLSSPSLPVVFAQIDDYTADTVNYSQWDTVQAQQAAVAIAGVSMIETDDLPLGPDGMHLTALSYYTVGRRFAAAWLQLTAPRTSSSSIVAGVVNMNGTQTGGSFTVTHPQTGAYVITYLVPFASPPVVSVTSYTQAAFPIVQSWADHASVINYTTSLALIDNAFSFVAQPAG